jgi:hypothetical protein
LKDRGLAARYFCQFIFHKILYILVDNCRV